MIFVSYSHSDEKWRKRFEIISKPLSRSEGIRFWSDHDLRLGEWENQIEKAMKGAVAAVLLVSDSFLASDYIVSKELPLILRLAKQEGLAICWAYLEPCDLKRHPEITNFQAMTRGALEPMSKMTDWQWKECMLRGCDLIDDVLKGFERPVVNRNLNGRAFPRIADPLALLAKASRRDVEVLVYAGDRKWWRQKPIPAGSTETRIYLGTDQTKKGTKFPVCVMTTEKPLTQQTYLNLPDHRTKSDEIVLVRR